MENGEAKEKAKEAPAPAAPPEARCWVDQGILRLEVPLFMPNGEYIAYGMLHKATQIVSAFFRHIERETQKDAELGRRILTPTGMPRSQ